MLAAQWPADQFGLVDKDPDEFRVTIVSSDALGADQTLIRRRVGRLLATGHRSDVGAVGDGYGEIVRERVRAFYSGNTRGICAYLMRGRHHINDGCKLQIC